MGILYNEKADVLVRPHEGWKKLIHLRNIYAIWMCDLSTIMIIIPEGAAAAVPAERTKQIF